MNYFHKLNKNIISQDVATYQGILLHQVDVTKKL